MTRLECKHCGRFIAEVETIVGELQCPNSKCKAGNQFKVLSPKELYSYTFESDPKPPKSER